MKTVARLISLLSLVGTIAPPMLFFTSSMSLASMQWWMLASTIGWFLATPLWMER
jgi:hypothetical protein